MRNARIAESLLEAIQASQNVQASASANPILSEALNNVMAMLHRDDDGWDLYIGGDRDEPRGLNLDDLKAWEKRLQEFQAANGWGKHGFTLRDSYINQDEPVFDGVPSEGRGRGTNVNEVINHPLNQYVYFNRSARRRREGRLYHAGLALYIGNNDTKILEAVPLSEITGVLPHPDHDDIILAYRRSWSRRQKNGKYKDMVRWYFVDLFKDHEVSEIVHNTQREKVETGYTAFDMHANSVEGWRFGVPDALAAWIWAEIAKGLYMDGVDVSEAMASIAYKATAGTAQSGQNARVQFGNAQGAGSTAVVGGGNDLVAMTSAKSGYDFSSLREVVALIAASLDVSTIHLTSNPGDAGSSYGSAQTLDLPTRLAMITRRQEHADFDLRVLRWMAGPTAGRNIKVHFPLLEDPAEQYRKMQMATLPWLQGVVSPEVYQQVVASIMGVRELGAIPEGLLIPNNKKSLPRSDIDTDGSPASSSGSPTQGRSTGTGDSDRANDIRSDTIS